MRRMMNQAHANDCPDNHSEVAAQRIADLASNMRTVKNTEVMNDLGPTFQPGPCDVICARGKSAFQHEGNQRFRAIIEQRMEQYASAGNKFEKSVIVSQVVDEIRQASPQGGFVRSDKGRWYEVGDHIAREKVGQRYVSLRRFQNGTTSLVVPYSTYMFLVWLAFVTCSMPSIARAQRPKSCVSKTAEFSPLRMKREPLVKRPVMVSRKKSSLKDRNMR